MNKNLAIPFSVVFMFLLLAACVKDTDFNQAEDIALTPVVELDLIYFNIDAGEFFNELTSTPRLTLIDTTEIRFLDDSQIQESLIRAEFLFRFTNSISREFQVDFQFLSEVNDTTYTIQTTVPAGTIELPATPPDFIENIEGDDIMLLTQATKVVVSVTISSSNASLEGVLNMQSKTTYFLEF